MLSACASGLGFATCRIPTRDLQLELGRRGPSQKEQRLWCLLPPRYTKQCPLAARMSSQVLSKG